MKKFEFFNQFHNPVLVIQNDQKEVKYRNNAFLRCFPDFTTLKKFSHKLNSEIYLLDSDDWELHLPLIQAIRSKEDFVTHVSYQNKNNEYTFYDINALKRNGYTIVFFTDVTMNKKYEKVVEEKQNIETGAISSIKNGFGK